MNLPMYSWFSTFKKLSFFQSDESMCIRSFTLLKRNIYKLRDNYFVDGKWMRSSATFHSHIHFSKKQRKQQRIYLKQGGKEQFQELWEWGEVSGQNSVNQGVEETKIHWKNERKPVWGRSESGLTGCPAELKLEWYAGTRGSGAAKLWSRRWIYHETNKTWPSVALTCLSTILDFVPNIKFLIFYSFSLKENPNCIMSGSHNLNPPVC